MKFPSVQNILAFLKKLINKKVLIPLIILLVVWNIGNRNAQDTSKIKFYKVATNTIKSNVISSGKIQADQSTDLHFQTGGQVAWINIKDGNFSLDWKKNEFAQKHCPLYNDVIIELTNEEIATICKEHLAPKDCDIYTFAKAILRKAQEK